MSDKRQNATERRLSHVRALKEQFFSEPGFEENHILAQLHDRDATLEAMSSEITMLHAQLSQRESELATREELIDELDHELEQLRQRLRRRVPIAESQPPQTKRRPADDTPHFDFYSSD